MTISLTLDGDLERVNDPEYLRHLSQKEVERFNQYLIDVDPWFKEGGLVKNERLAIEGYIYQKVKGHIDAHHNNSFGDSERKDG